MSRKIIKETKYCQILTQGKVTDKAYTYCIERIFVKCKNREEIRFSLYKETTKSTEQYIPRSLDVTEQELLQLIKKSLQKSVFSKEFIKDLSDTLNAKTEPT